MSNNTTVVAYFNKWLRLKGIFSVRPKCICDDCSPIQGFKDLTQKIGAYGKNLRDDIDPQSLSRLEKTFADDYAMGKRLLTESWNRVARKLRESDSDGCLNWHRSIAKKGLAKSTNETRIIEVPKETVGLIIGRKGQTKSNMEAKSQAKIEVKNNGNVEVSGTPDSIKTAVDLILQKVESAKRN